MQRPCRYHALPCVTTPPAALSAAGLPARSPVHPLDVNPTPSEVQAPERSQPSPLALGASWPFMVNRPLRARPCASGARVGMVARPAVSANRPPTAATSTAPVTCATPVFQADLAVGMRSALACPRSRLPRRPARPAVARAAPALPRPPPPTAPLRRLNRPAEVPPAAPRIACLRPAAARPARSPAPARLPPLRAHPPPPRCSPVRPPLRGPAWTVGRVCNATPLPPPKNPRLTAPYSLARLSTANVFPKAYDIDIRCHDTDIFRRESDAWPKRA
jgi:hypothetical protein